jgi:hypothetical protein
MIRFKEYLLKIKIMINGRPINNLNTVRVETMGMMSLKILPGILSENRRMRALEYRRCMHRLYGAYRRINVMKWIDLRWGAIVPTIGECIWIKKRRMPFAPTWHII